MSKGYGQSSWRLLLLAVVGLVPLHPIVEADAFWQMTLGRAVWRHGSRVVPEPTAFVSFSDPAVAPEWAWGLLTWAVHLAGGWEALTWVVVLGAMLFACALLAMLSSAARTTHDGAQALVAACVATTVLGRARLRPQLAFFVLLASAIWLAYRYVQASPETRRRWGLLVVAHAVLWAQFHGSFVLAPAVFGAVLAPTLLAHWRQPRTLRSHLLTLGCVVLSLASSAHGFSVVGFILDHSGGYATQFIADMQRSHWRTFNPFHMPMAAGMAILWLLAALGAARAWRMPIDRLLLAALGLALSLTAVRFMAAAAVLTAPAALWGAEQLWQAMHERLSGRARWLTPLVTALVAVGLLSWVARNTHQGFGPWGQTGLAEGKHPQAARAYLQRLPAGAQVLSVFPVSAQLGFWFDGRIRTYVSGRTPLYFDDTDFAIMRNVFGDEEALFRAATHFGVSAAVVRRKQSACLYLSERWRAVALDPLFTTFVPADRATPVLTGLAPCGQQLLTADACRDVAATERAIAQVSALHDSGLTALLRASVALDCRHDLVQAQKLLPAPTKVWHYRRHWRRLQTEILVRVKAWPRAFDLMEEGLASGDPSALRLLDVTEAVQHVGLPRVRAALQAGQNLLGERTHSSRLTNLALICAEQGDAKCVRLNAMRAASKGDRGVLPALRWLEKNHPSDRAQREASKWAATLSKVTGGEPLKQLEEQYAETPSAAATETDDGDL